MSTPRWSDLYGIDPNFVADQPVTPDREALDPDAATLRTLSRFFAGALMEPQHQCEECEAVRVALSPYLTEALDRARQQGKQEGREQAAQAIEAYAAELRRRTDALGSRLLRVDIAARLARGGPNRKDEE